MLDWYETNLTKWHKWAAVNPYNLLISYPRGGRAWIGKVLKMRTGQVVGPPESANLPFDKYTLFLHHGGREKEELFKTLHNAKIILLLRDPRDCALSDAYRCVWFDQHPEITKMSRALMTRRIQEVCKLWNVRIKDYEQKADLIIQYEQLCLTPKIVMRSLLETIGVSGKAYLDKAITSLDKLVLTRLREDLSVERVLQPTTFTSGVERYKAHCQKWKQDELFTEEDNQTVLIALGKNMKRFGYLQNGHDTERWING